MILKNLFRRKGRTLSTLVGIAIGVAAIIALGAMAEGMRAGYTAMARGSQADLVLSPTEAMDITLGGIDATFTNMAISSSVGGPAVNVAMISGGSLTMDGTSTVSATNLAGVMAGVSIDANNSDFTVEVSSVSVEGNGMGGTGIAVTRLGAGGSANGGARHSRCDLCR